MDGEETFFVSFKPPRLGTEPRTLAWKAAELTTTLGPPPHSRKDIKTMMLGLYIYVFTHISFPMKCHWILENNQGWSNENPPPPRGRQSGFFRRQGKTEHFFIKEWASIYTFLVAVVLCQQLFPRGWFTQYMSHEEIPGTVVLKNSSKPGSVIWQGPRFQGGVGVFFSSWRPWGICTGTALSGRWSAYEMLEIAFQFQL